MLEIKNLSVNYGGIQALQDVSLTVNEGEVVTLIGANGAGKTTTLRSISGLVSPRSGEIIYNGKNITSLRPDQIVQVGIAHSPEGRRVLARQTVLDNLELGAFVRSDRWGIKADIEKTISSSPTLRSKKDLIMQFIQSINKEIFKKISLSRNISMDRLNTIADSLQAMDPIKAQKAGLLTIGYWDEFEGQMRVATKIKPSDDLTYVKLADYLNEKEHMKNEANDARHQLQHCLAEVKKHYLLLIAI
jgi:ABC-type sugar transport system ATPase subunit